MSSRDESVFYASSSTTAADSTAQLQSSNEFGLNTPSTLNAHESSKKRLWFPGRRATSTWPQKEHATSQDDTRGPLGLVLLHASPQPQIDLIFVHGLRGGSIKSWRKGNDIRQFWPQRWLPMEHDLYHASIHSFGYDSDWGSSRPNILGINDFGRALYEEMKASPILRQRPNCPILLIGHSMGGLVVKKMYTLAHQDASYSQLARRIRSIFFLATPHRGSDYASVLNALLKFAGLSGMVSSREYVEDLKKGSTSAQLINEDFARHVDGLPIYSFFETLETNLGVSSSILVGRDSAVLGSGFNETSRYMHANHRDICKFDDPTDQNYISLKNCICSAVQDILHDDAFACGAESTEAQMRAIQTFLGVASSPDDIFEEVEGSCEWLNSREDFRNWRDAAHDNDGAEESSHGPSIYWVTAAPGAGKSVLSGYVSCQLESLGLQPSVYYFHFGKKATQSLAGMLRSVAFQMAVTNTSIRQSLAKLCDDGVPYDQDNAHAIWTKVFRAVIMQAPTSTPQYWIIDGLDECIKYGEFFIMLKTARSRFPLRVFLTSRKLPDMQKFTRQLQFCVTWFVEIPLPDTMGDIERFVRSRMDYLPIDSESDKDGLIQEILAKSEASFLWARLVMDELEGVYGYESILSVLNDIPEGMKSYYHRTVSEMATNKREKHIAKSILSWVVTASRPLSVPELSEALTLDIGIHLPSARTAVEGLCGQLVHVDKHTGLVHVVHNTARDFLTSDEAGEFRVSKSQSHERVALICLRLLVSPSMHSPRHRKLLGQKRSQGLGSPLLDYAIMQFSEHLSGASAEADELLLALSRFLSTTVLTWIERLGTRKTLHRLIRTARNLKAYLDRRAKYCSPLNQHVKSVDGWATDLSRLVTRFGKALMIQPESIYFLIPPLCPKNTAIFTQFGRSVDGLSCTGISNTWDDRAATINLEDERAVAIACDNGTIVAGLESGKICLYNDGSFHRELIFEQGTSVDLLLVDPIGSFIASTSFRHIYVWASDGSLMWKKRLRSRCIMLETTDSSIVAVTMAGRCLHWDANSGALLHEDEYPYQSTEPVESGPVQRKAPFTGTVSPDFSLLALAYRTGPICIFDLATHAWTAHATDTNSRNAAMVYFNPNPEVQILLVAYDEGHLALYDSWSGQLLHFQTSLTRAVFTSLTCSSDGRTFATVDVLGNLQIWDFESLTVLYHILTPRHSFRLLKFTANAFSLVDMVDHEIRVWSPAVLVRKVMEEEASMSDQAVILPVAEGEFESFRFSRIRALASSQKTSAIFAGNQNGDVLHIDISDGLKQNIIYSHQGAIIKCVSLAGNHLIASGDTNGAVQVWELDSSKTGKWEAGTLRIRANFASAINQLLFSESGLYLLIATTDCDHIYDVLSGDLVGSLPAHSHRHMWQWMTLPDNRNAFHFALLNGRKLKFYSAQNFPSEICGGSIDLDYNTELGLSEINIRSAVIHGETMSLIMDIGLQHEHLTTSSVLIFKLGDCLQNTDHVVLRSEQTVATNMSMMFLGTTGADSRLVFLHQNSWVSSIDLVDLESPYFLQHFFVPTEFLTTSVDVLPIQTWDNRFVFSLHDSVAVIENGLRFSEMKKT